MEMRPSPKSLVLDLLSTLPGRGRHAMPVRALVEAGRSFGLAESSLRVAVARLLAQGRIERDERGRYREGRGAGPVSGVVRAWRSLEEKRVDWQGGWVAVQPQPGAARSQRILTDRALRFLGFRELRPGLLLRPDNLEAGVFGVRAQLEESGLMPTALVFGARDFDDAHEERARLLWDVEALTRGYREATRELARSRDHLEAASLEDAMVETFRLGGRVIRQLVLDPRLPSEIAPPESRHELIAAMVDYDLFGRSRWADFRARHGISQRRAPADLRIFEDENNRMPLGSANREGQGAVEWPQRS
jgi:phenylacetic acid degradation operon negative regulatory protein